MGGGGGGGGAHVQITNIASVGGWSHQYFCLLLKINNILHRGPYYTPSRTNCFVMGGMGSVEAFSQLWFIRGGLPPPPPLWICPGGWGGTFGPVYEAEKGTPAWNGPRPHIWKINNYLLSLFEQTLALPFILQWACIGVLGIQDTFHFTSRDIGYYPFYFQGYWILGSIFSLLPGILRI